MHLFNIIAFHLFIELFILLVAKIVKADQVEYDLIHSILKDYDPSIRPSVHHNYTLNVTFGLSLTQLIDIVIEKYQKLLLYYISIFYF